jgi:hypothetical protein
MIRGGSTEVLHRGQMSLSATSYGEGRGRRARIAEGARLSWRDQSVQSPTQVKPSGRVATPPCVRRGRQSSVVRAPPASPTVPAQARRGVGRGNDARISARGDPTAWLPFLDTYRTMCCAPEPAFRRILEDIRDLPFGA